MPRALIRAIAAAVLTVSVQVRAAEPNQLTSAEQAEGWILLFDGKTDFGWQAGSKADWKVVDGAIAVTSGEAGLLHTTSQFDNFVLRVDFRSTRETNSGVFLRTIAAPRDPLDHCYELNIADASISKFPTGSVVGRKRGADAPFSADWRTYEVTADGDHLTATLDGKPAVDYTDRHPLARGFIGLQYNTGKAEFRNIKLRPLGLKSIFNGKNLAGWQPFAGQKTKASVTPEGYLRIEDGKGQLETEQKFGDFTLQLEAISNAKDANSGVFFRCIPGELLNGYECQLENRYKDGDRAKPVDCGTGGIYRRQNARQVLANDFQWFALTLIVSGDHMATWVDGTQVCDVTDSRPPNDNPRKGLRTEAGTLSLQGHDATTDFSFRRLRAAEMAK